MTARTLDVVASLRDPRLLGGLPAFRDLSTWGPWLVFVKAVYGLPLDAAELEIFRKHTGRREPRVGGYPEAVAVVGVQSGKTRIAAALADFAALTGESGTHALLVGQDHRGAMRALLRYAKEPFDALDSFRAEVVRETVDTLELRNGVSLSAYPCRPAAVRGIRACVAIVDELAFFTATDGRPTDREMLRVARGRVATTGGKVIVLSSPYGQAGALWDLYRAQYGRDDSPTLVWQATAPEMNPMLPADYLERTRTEDPEATESEVEGRFRAGLSALFEAEAIEAVVVSGRRELPPLEGVRYRAFADPSGGRSDAFTVAVGHRSDERRIVLDALRAWKAPFNPTSVVAEAAALIKSYRVFEVTGDRYAGEWPRDAFRAHGIHYATAAKDRSQLYVELVPVVNAGGLELLDQAELLRELRGLERRRGNSGRDRVDHRRGAHDDRANALAGLVSLLPASRSGARMVHALTGRPITGLEWAAGMRSGDPLLWEGEDRAALESK